MIYKQNPDVIRRIIAEETFLIPVHKNLADMNNIYVLHGTGDFIWDHIDGKKSIEEIVGLITEQFDVSHSRAFGDTKDIIGDMEKSGLIVQV